MAHERRGKKPKRVDIIDESLQISKILRATVQFARANRDEKK